MSTYPDQSATQGRESRPWECPACGRTVFATQQPKPCERHPSTPMREVAL